MCVEVSHLRYVAVAAEHRSFRRAAVALNITQPTLSKRIREIEERLGVLLFVRSSGGAYLTAEGEVFVASARCVLAELKGMEDRAKAAKIGNVGRLQIGLYTTLAGPLRDTVFSFARKYPQIDLGVIEDNRKALIPLLDRGTIDIAVVLGDAADREYAHLSLWSERVMVVLPMTHPLAERDFVYWTDLRDERFVMSHRDPGPEIQNILLSKIALPGAQPFIEIVKAHHSLTISAVDSDRGITLACESSSVPSWPGVVFREVRDGAGPTRLGFVAYWQRNNDNPTLKQFLMLLQAHPAVPTTPGRG